MNSQDLSIYQSGQEVLFDGWYEAIAVKAPTYSQLTSGQLFPNHDGRAVGWHRIQTPPAVPEKVDGKSTSFGEADYHGGMYS